MQIINFTYCRVIVVAVPAVRGGFDQQLVHPSPWSPDLPGNAISFTIDRDARTHMKIKEPREDILRAGAGFARFRLGRDKRCTADKTEGPLFRERIE